MVSQHDYANDQVAAARAVLLELTHVLGEYRDEIVVVGGWVPELLLQGVPPHIGSIDVDLAFNHRRLKEAGYKAIEKLLLERGYQTGEQPYVFYRLVTVGERQLKVEVDLLAAEYGGTGKSHRSQKLHGVRARKARGCDLAFELNTEVEIRGTLPGGAKDVATIRVASIVPFLVMKGMALHDRMKEKDAWDIYYCLLHYPGGLVSLAQEFRSHLSHTLVREGLQKIGGKFASPEHYGPRAVADFEDLTDTLERERVQRDAYERVQQLLRALGITHE